MKLIEKKVDVGLEHEKQVLTKKSNCHKFTLCWGHPVHISLVMSTYLVCFLKPLILNNNKKSQVLIYKMKQHSEISAFGFFTVDRSLVTSFLANTFTYWVILVQFIKM